VNVPVAPAFLDGVGVLTGAGAAGVVAGVEAGVVAGVEAGVVAGVEAGVEDVDRGVVGTFLVVFLLFFAAFLVALGVDGMDGVDGVEAGALAVDRCDPCDGVEAGVLAVDAGVEGVINPELVAPVEPLPPSVRPEALPN